jgi:hypothetical protein
MRKAPDMLGVASEVQTCSGPITHGRETSSERSRSSVVISVVRIRWATATYTNVHC